MPVFGGQQEYYASVVLNKDYMNITMYLVAQCNGVDFRSPPILSTTAPLEIKYLEQLTTDTPTAVADNYPMCYYDKPSASVSFLFFWYHSLWLMI